jgi:hypothetical protein
MDSELVIDRTRPDGPRNRLVLRRDLHSPGAWVIIIHDGDDITSYHLDGGNVRTIAALLWHSTEQHMPGALDA